MGTFASAHLGHVYNGGKNGTVRSAETRQKIGQNQPIESISLTEMTTRVEFWLTENRQVSDQNRQKIS